jgi:PAS domain S-box-containing protein
MSLQAAASVLLVDDSRANLLSLRVILEHLGLNLVEARSGEEAIGLLQKQEFAVVLLDVLMPGISGLETASLIRSECRFPHTPIIFLTASDIDRSQTEEAYRLGAVDFLVKPVLPVALQAKVRSFVELFQDKQRTKREADQLRLLVHGTTEYAIFMLDPEGRVLTWNAGAERFKGYKAEEIIGQHFTKFYPQEAIDRGWPAHELKVATAEGRFEDEGWRIRKDGSRFWANVVITALRDEQGQLRGFSKVTRDLTERKKAEELLRRSEEKFRLLVEGANDYAIFLLDPQGNIASWNAGAERIKGYEAGEIIGQHFSKFYPQEAIDRGWPAHELKVATAEGRFEDEGWRVRKDGTQFWANVVITALHDDAGNFRGFSKITRDMTERKKAEENDRRLLEETTARRVAEENARQIHEERERLHVTLASIGDAVISTDAEGRINFLNSVAEELVGWKSEEAARCTLEDVFHIVNEDTRMPVENPALRALRDGKIVGLANHTVLISKDRTERPIDDSAAPIRDARGNVIGSVLVFRDISERRRNERKVREQQEWLRVTLASIGDAVIATDTQGRVTFLNPVAQELTGWAGEDAHGLPLEAVFQILNEQSRQTVENPVAKVLRDGVIVGLGNHTILIAKDSKERPIDDSAAPIRDASGNMMGVVLIFRDVTEQRLSDRELRSSEARKSAILETALDCVITMDHEGKVVEFNTAAERTFGFRREQVIGRELADLIIPPMLRERHRNGMAHYLATGEGPVLGKRLELPALRVDGTEFPVELAITRISTDGPPVFTAYLRDVSEPKRVEQHRNLRLAVTSALSEASSVDAGMSGVLRSVCEHLGWDVGFFWSADNGHLTCRGSWHRSEETAIDFEKASCSRTFEKEEGLPGRVWASGAPAWILDITQDANFPRLATAVDLGLHSAFAYPVVVANRTLGVIEFFTSHIRGADPGLLETMGTVAGNVGQFIERKVAEDDLRQSQQELAAELEATTRLHALSTRLLAAVDLHEALEDVLQEAVLTSRAAFGNVQLYNSHTHSLEIIVHSGFGEDFLYHFRTVRIDEGSACSQALESGERIIIEDVELEPAYEPHQEMAAATGYRAVQSTPLKNRKGDVIGMLSTHFSQPHRPSERELRLLDLYARHAADLIERHAFEQVLRRSEAQFRQLADVMPQIVWTAQPDGKIDYMNRRWTEFTGLPETVGNEGWGQILHPDEAQYASERWSASVRSGAPFEMQMRLLDRRKQIFRWHLIRTVAIDDEAGNVVRWFGTSTDIHEQKRAEESSRYLAEASAALASVVDHESTLQKVASLAVPYFADWSAVDMVNDDGSLRRLAVAHQDADKIALVHQLMQDYPPDPTSPSGAHAVLRTGKPQIISEISDDMLVQGAKDERHLSLIRSLGLKSYICVPLIVAGNALGVLTFATAESGRRYTEADLVLAMDLASRAAVAIENTQLYQALRETDRRKDEFLATLAHELRNPLAPIRNSLQILKMPRVDAETVQRSREMMERQVHHLVRLVDDLLDVSRVMRGKIELRREAVELATVVARAVETVQPLVEAQGHQLSIQLPPESLVIDVDPVRLAQVIGNLLTNAAKYTEPGGHIWLTAQRDGDTAELRVRDNGIGIEKNMLPRIFELFVQVDHASTKAQGGLGIGLTLVKNLVEMHNGTVEAHSEGLGKGSEFVVRLPTSAQQLQEDAPNAGQRSDTGVPSGHRLLVVDDNQDAAVSLAMLLKLQGHEVRVAHSGMAALEMAKSYVPDVVFLDIGMPGMDGYEVARRMRQQPGLEKVVLAALTGWGQREDRRRSAEAGFNHHLIKPPELKAIESVIAELKRLQGR